MKALMLLTGGGPMVILTSFDSPTASGLINKLASKGITKFIAYELPFDLVQERYGNHFAVVQRDLRETDDLRVLDYNGQRAFNLFHFDEMGPATLYEASENAGAAVFRSEREVSA
jgi:alpha-D-ribose 1-methylphosphonate 5-triphosphate synthase subunit PhnH